MSHKLLHGLVPINGQLVESYLRETKASDDIKQTLGLSANEQILANIGLSSIEEYLTLESDGTIAKGDFRLWDLTPFEQPFKIESILIDSPYNDTFTLQLLNEGNQVKFSQPFERKKTTEQLPLIVVKRNWKIKIIATNSPIDYLQIIGKPIALLEVIYSDDQGANGNNNSTSNGNIYSTSDNNNFFFLLGIN